jgi:Spy/CpxP family protein refolding chaperone
MNNRSITIAVIVAGILVAIGVNFAVRQSTSTGDAESLRAQQKAAGLPQNVTAVRGPNPGQMFASLNLTEDQKTKVDAVMKEMQTEMRNGPRPDPSSGANPEQMFARMQEMRTKQEGKLKEILTAEQFAQFQKEQQERMSNMPAMGGPGMGGPPMGMPGMGGPPMGGPPSGIPN